MSMRGLHLQLRGLWLITHQRLDALPGFPRPSRQSQGLTQRSQCSALFRRLESFEDSVQYVM